MAGRPAGLTASNGLGLSICCLGLKWVTRGKEGESLLHGRGDGFLDPVSVTSLLIGRFREVINLITGCSDKRVVGGSHPPTLLEAGGTRSSHSVSPSPLLLSSVLSRPFFLLGLGALLSSVTLTLIPLHSCSLLLHLSLLLFLQQLRRCRPLSSCLAPSGAE